MGAVSVWINGETHYRGVLSITTARHVRFSSRSTGIAQRQECGRWLNARAENSHQPLRCREVAMARFRDMKTRQKFAAVRASIHNHFNQERHRPCLSRSRSKPVPARRPADCRKLYRQFEIRLEILQYQRLAGGAESLERTRFRG